MDWNASNIALLRRLWADGLSASIIADRFGVTKNAICGKVYRLGLPQRRTTMRAVFVSSSRQIIHVLEDA